MFYLLHKHRWNTKPFPLIIFWCERRDLLCGHSNGDIFRCEFWHVKISSFRGKVHWYFIGVYIIRVVSSAYWLILTSSIPREKPLMLLLFRTVLAKASAARINKCGKWGGGLRDLLTFFSFLWLKISVGYFLIIKCGLLNNNAIFLLR